MSVRGENRTSKDKIKDIDELARILTAHRAEGKKIVHCHGVFDLLHIGHIRHLDQAKGFGDILVVTLTPDRYVNKGPHRPAFPEALRAEAIGAFGCVDYVAINRWPMAVEVIHLLRPHFYVKGPDYKQAEKDRTGGITLERKAVESVNGQMVFTEDVTFSASQLLNKYLPAFPKPVTDYLGQFTKSYSAEDVLRYLDNAKTQKVLVMGEAIIDEYQYCETMGKSGKEPILAARYVSNEKFAGGILAVANHVAAFCEHPCLLTFLGTHDSQEDFIREKLDPRIEGIFLRYPDDTPTIVKRRFVEVYPFQKLFEVYVMNEEDSAACSNALCAKLNDLLPKYDVVIVVDYGHGMMGPEAIDILCRQARFLAVNTQVNAANRGFNTITKYHRADYICISENEIRLEARSRHRELRDIVLHVAEKLSCPRIMITRGKQGSLCYGKEEGFFEVPAFTSTVVDRIGAGDAVFSITALCVAQKAPIEVVGFVANVVGAQAVGIVGHRKPIERVPLYRYIESLLK
jgi:rfaE bifunctional protein nucleotidyltransferase chain/domain